jgi:hypothetical protein
MEFSIDGLLERDLEANLRWSMLESKSKAVSALLIVEVSISYRYEYNNLAFRCGAHTMETLLFAKNLVVIKI